jgi:hypothetical protein
LKYIGLFHSDMQDTAVRTLSTASFSHKMTLHGIQELSIFLTGSVVNHLRALSQFACRKEENHKLTNTKQKAQCLGFVGWGEVRLSPLGTSATNWPIIPAPDDRWVWSMWWIENWQGKPNYSEKTCPSATWYTTNPTWPDIRSNPGRCCGKQATNSLSYGTALRGVLDSLLWISGLIWKMLFFFCFDLRIYHSVAAASFSFVTGKYIAFELVIVVFSPTFQKC